MNSIRKKAINRQRDNRLYKITEEGFIFIKNMITVFIVEVIKDAL